MKGPAGPRRQGFTVAEMAVASLMMAVASALMAQTWAGFGRTAIAAVARARLAQEANLAAAAIANDVGRLARAQGPTDSRYEAVQAGSGGSSLTMTIDDGTGTPRSIRYAVDPSDHSKLLRTDLTALPSEDRVVAALVSAFQATRLDATGAYGMAGVEIQLTLTHRTYDRDPNGNFRSDHTRRYTLFLPDP
jgi:type II secretory pathway component PulJ